MPKPNCVLSVLVVEFFFRFQETALGAEVIGPRKRENGRTDGGTAGRELGYLQHNSQHQEHTQPLSCSHRGFLKPGTCTRSSASHTVRIKPEREREKQDSVQKQHPAGELSKTGNYKYKERNETSVSDATHPTLGL